MSGSVVHFHHTISCFIAKHIFIFFIWHFIKTHSVDFIFAFPSLRSVLRILSFLFFPLFSLFFPPLTITGFPFFILFNYLTIQLSNHSIIPIHFTHVSSPFHFFTLIFTIFPLFFLTIPSISISYNYHSNHCYLSIFSQRNVIFSLSH